MIFQSARTSTDRPQSHSWLKIYKLLITRVVFPKNEGLVPENSTDHGIWGSHFEKQNQGHIHLKMTTSRSLITWEAPLHSLLNFLNNQYYWYEPTDIMHALLGNKIMIKNCSNPRPPIKLTDSIELYGSPKKIKSLNL